MQNDTAVSEEESGNLDCAMLINKYKYIHFTFLYTQK